MDVRDIEQRIEEKRKQIAQLSIDLLSLERAKKDALKEQKEDTKKLLQG